MSVISVDGVIIANKTIVITRGGDFQEQWTFADSDEVVTPLLEAKIMIEPDGAASEEWTQANGRFTNVSDGVYLLTLSVAYTTAIAWDSGSYHVYIVEASGFIDPCVTNGFLFAVDC